MQTIKKFFTPDPGNRNESSGSENSSGRTDNSQEQSEINENADKKKGKSKFDEALQQWSNDDARDRAEDDSTPLRSGL